MNIRALLATNFLRILSVLDLSFKRRAGAIFCGMFCLSLLELGCILLLTLFFSTLASDSGPPSSGVFHKAATVFPALESLAAKPGGLLFVFSFFPAAAIILKNIASWLVQRSMTRLGEDASFQVGHAMLGTFLHLPYTRHLALPPTQALINFGRRSFVGQSLLLCLTVYSNLLTSALLFLGLAWYAPGSTLVVLAVMGVAVPIVYRLLRGELDACSARAARAQEREGRIAFTAANAVREVLIHRLQKVFLDAVAVPMRESAAARSFLQIAPTVPTWVLESCGFLLICASVGTLVFVNRAAPAEIGAVIAMLGLTAWRVLPSLNRAVGAVVSLRGMAGPTLACLDYFEGLRALPTEAEVEPDPAFAFLRGIRLENVSFTYPGAENPALCGIDLEIPKGRAVGVVGRSGAGKSTLVTLLSGLARPTAGRLLVDEHPLGPAQLAAYRELVGYVPQAPALLPGSLAENISLSRWGEPVDPARLRDACAAAAIDFLGDGGEDAHRLVGDGESGLSGGQIQRIAVARALYADPAVLIFDEATSSLDQAGEALVQQSLRNLKGAPTCVIVAHRLSTLDICDVLVWLENGRLREVGPTAEILPKYRSSLR